MLSEKKLINAALAIVALLLLWICVRSVTGGMAHGGTQPGGGTDSVAAGGR